MGGCKPVLHYPSRTAAVLDLRDKGLAYREIADQTGILERNVRALEYSAKYGARETDPRSLKARTLRLSPDTVQALDRPAQRRGMTPRDLALRIVETAMRDGMIDAILDDQEAGQ